MNQNGNEGSKMKYIFVIIIISSLWSVLFGENITFSYKNIDYNISCSQKDFEYISKLNYTHPEIDTMFSLNDTVLVFIRIEGFIAFCSKSSKSIDLLNFQYTPYQTFHELFCLDLNNDNQYEIVALLGDEDRSYLIAFSFNDTKKKLVNVLYKELYHFRDLGYYDDVTIKNGKLYFVYSPNEDGFDILKMGTIDYTHDESKEVYFRPISITTKRKWEKFLNSQK